MTETPIYDQLIAERLGRGPAEFEGHETWDESEEATEAYARGVAEAERTWEEFWGKPSCIRPSQSKQRQRQRKRRAAG
ncbi:MAG TPA: hypothetical protein VIL34_03495 [Actinopolymorphaceae bacterium]|jgi:hypothetical protein